jgi:membrane protein implicated in regulation of membrane protease activity
MYERIAILLVDAFYLYAALGVVFGLAFVTVGVKRIDSQAIDSGTAFRLLIFPGAVALWPLLLRRWIAGKSEPPEERNPHR